MEKRKTVGLALGSGGVRGLAHLGVVRALLAHDIPIDFISGSSIGSWVGAHYSLFQDLELTTSLTVGKKKEKLVSFLEPNIFGGGLVKGAKVEAMIDGWLAGASFADLKIPFKAVATDLISGQRVVFSKGKLSSAVRASMAVPGFFKPVVLDSQALSDGGLSDPVPVGLVREMGAEVVVAVNLDIFPGLGDISPQNIGYADIVDSSILIMRHYLAQSACRDADFVIQPSLRGQATWRRYFMSNDEEKIMQLAEKEVEKIIPDLKKQIFG